MSSDNNSKPLGMSEIEDSSEIQRMSKWFERFSEQAKGSIIYEFFSLQISKDPQMLAIASKSNPSQPAPNLFLAAVHFLLMNNPQEQLANFYPSLGGQFESPEKAFIEFKTFVAKYESKILDLLKSKLVQTNEVQRCALLFPALNYISTHIHHKPIALIDVGVSGGLNFLLDQVGISYSDGKRITSKESHLSLDCLSKGESLPPFKPVKIQRRIGIDLNTINLKDPSERLWNLALLWPDQLERIERFNHAVKDLEKINIEFHRGSGNDLIPAIIKDISIEGIICVMHSFTLNQFSKEDRKSFDAQLKQQSKSRDVWRVSLEWIGTSNPELVVSKYKSGEVVQQEKLAECHGHGEWINWMGAHEN